MGSIHSVPEASSLEESLNDLDSLIKNDKFDTTELKDNILRLKKNANDFFEIYSHNHISKVIGINISSFFDKIEKIIKSFKKYIKYYTRINTFSEKTKNNLLLAFQQELGDFLTSLSNISIYLTKILQRLIRMIDRKIDEKYIKKIKTQFYLEISIYIFALNYQTSPNVPFYQISPLLIYFHHHDDIHGTYQKFLNIIGPNGSGKTMIVPLLIASRSLGYTITSRSIILVENDTESIQRIEECYNQINSKNDDNCLIITSSLQTFYEKLSDKSEPTIIAIFTPIEALQIIRKEINDFKGLEDKFVKITNFLKYTTFIIDNIDQRAIEADVLAQDIIDNVFYKDLHDERIKFVLLGNTSDSRFLNIFYHHYDSFEIPFNDALVNTIKVKCKSVSDIIKRGMIHEMKNFFSSWIDDDKVDLGSVLVFVPNSKAGHSMSKHINQLNKLCPYKIVFLTSKINRGEKLDDYYQRLMIEIDQETVKRTSNLSDAYKSDTSSADSNILFLLLFDLSSNIINEEKLFLESKLPDPFIDKKFSRVIITTNKNENFRFIRIPDVTVIFDSGLGEIDYYEYQRNCLLFKTEQLPLTFLKQRNVLINPKKRGVHFIFESNTSLRLQDITPSVQRCNMIQSILQLRKININFEEQMNLPNEPPYEAKMKQINFLKKNNIINQISNELTELGQRVSKFSSVSFYFALSTALFNGNNDEFAFFVSLIIERFVDLIDNYQAPLLCNHFCRDSDIVTVLESILAMNTADGDNLLNEDEVDYENSGILKICLQSIYITMANTFEAANKSEGREIAINSIKQAKRQPGGLLSMVDKYVSLLDKENFLDLRRATFEFILGAGEGYETTIVYKANDYFKFNKTDEEATVKFSKRPGWIGLQTPGDIIVLSVQINEEIKLNHGYAIHRDPSNIDKNLGVVSQEENIVCLNSCFFISLFEAYWTNHPNANNMIGIYYSNRPDDETAFLIHTAKINDKILINFCPKLPEVKDELSLTIPFLSSLMQFVPRSIIFQTEIPSCFTEIISYGTSKEYKNVIYSTDVPKTKVPFAYHLNKETLEYANNQKNEMRKTDPKVRFAITGEGVIYNFKDGRQLDTSLSLPNINPKIKSVFDPLHSSHLVLIVDQDYANKPGDKPLNWFPKSDGSAEKTNEDNEKQLIVDLSTKILNGLGVCEFQDDIFFVTLNGSDICVNEADIPDEIKNQINLDHGKVTDGIHKLINQFTRPFSRGYNLLKPIKLKTFDSTNTYAIDDSQIEETIEQINRVVSDGLHLEIYNVNSIFIGHSLICIRIKNLPHSITTHAQPKDVWDDSYYPCEADEMIKGILTANSFPVTTVVHETSVTFTLYHLPRLNIDKDEFVNRVNDIALKFGFLVSLISGYAEGGHDAESERFIMGEMQVGIFRASSCVAFATCISQEFPISKGDEDLGMSLTMTMSTMSTMRSLYGLNPKLGRPPEVSSNQIAFRVSASEIELMKDLIKYKKRWEFDEKYRVLIIPFLDEEEAISKMHEVRKKKIDVACLSMCENDIPKLLPQCIYAYQKDGSVKPFGICKDCAFWLLSTDETINFIFNPVTQLIDQDKLADSISQNLKGLALLDDTKDSNGEYWPQVPFGQLVWSMMSDTENQLPPYIKAWFTIANEKAIRTSGLFVFCPNHNRIPIMKLSESETIKCRVCNMMFCKDCMSWHEMGTPCYQGLKGIPRCPDCHTPCEKTEGCNHMTCTICKTEWNYQTGQRM